MFSRTTPTEISTVTLPKIASHSVKSKMKKLQSELRYISTESLLKDIDVLLQCININQVKRFLIWLTCLVDFSLVIIKFMCAANNNIDNTNNILLLKKLDLPHYFVQNECINSIFIWMNIV